MDGASKFVHGDAIAGLLITAINLVEKLDEVLRVLTPIRDAFKTAVDAAG